MIEHTPTLFMGLLRQDVEPSLLLHHDICLNILDALVRHADSGPFTSPLDPESWNIHPDALQGMKEIDLTTLRKNVQEGFYLHPYQFMSDLRLLFANIREIWDKKPSALIRKMAKTLEKHLDGLLKKLDPGVLAVMTNMEVDMSSSRPTTPMLINEEDDLQSALISKMAITSDESQINKLSISPPRKNNAGRKKKMDSSVDESDSPRPAAKKPRTSKQQSTSITSEPLSSSPSPETDSQPPLTLPKGCAHVSEDNADDLVTLPRDLPSPCVEPTSESVHPVSGEINFIPDQSIALMKKRPYKKKDLQLSSVKTPKATSSSKKTKTPASMNMTSQTASANGSSVKGNSPARQCGYCGTLTTPMWRHGPAGHDPLCNSCGVKWKRGRILKGLPVAAAPSPRRVPSTSSTISSSSSGSGNNSWGTVSHSQSHSETSSVASATTAATSGLSTGPTTTIASTERDMSGVTMVKISCSDSSSLSIKLSGFEPKRSEGHPLETPRPGTSVVTHHQSTRGRYRGGVSPVPDFSTPTPVDRSYKRKAGRPPSYVRKSSVTPLPSPSLKSSRRIQLKYKDLAQAQVPELSMEEEEDMMDANGADECTRMGEFLTSLKLNQASNTWGLAPGAAERLHAYDGPLPENTLNLRHVLHDSSQATSIVDCTSDTECNTHTLRSRTNTTEVQETIPIALPSTVDPLFFDPSCISSPEARSKYLKEQLRFLPVPGLAEVLCLLYPLVGREVQHAIDYGHDALVDVRDLDDRTWKSLCCILTRS